MTSHVKLRKERVGVVDYDTQIKGKENYLHIHNGTYFLPPFFVNDQSMYFQQNFQDQFQVPRSISILMTWMSNFLSLCFLSVLSLWVSLPLCLSEVRCQLVDQLKVLDTQLEQKSQQLQDLTDYLRRRGEIEGEYARSLDKLAERFTSRIKK